MAIVNPVSDVSIAMLTAHANGNEQCFLPPLLMSIVLRWTWIRHLSKLIPERITEPLSELDAPLDEVGDPLLSDTDEESSDIDVLEDMPGRGRRPHTATIVRQQALKMLFRATCVTSVV